MSSPWNGLPCSSVSLSPFLLCSLPPRCFCKDCLDMLVRPGTFDEVKDIDPWKCYMCDPSQCSGNLKLRPNWRVKVQDFFANDTGMEFVRVTPTSAAHRQLSGSIFTKHNVYFLFLLLNLYRRNHTEFTPPSLLISADPSGCSRSLTALPQVRSRRCLSDVVRLFKMPPLLRSSPSLSSLD